MMKRAIFTMALAISCTLLLGAEEEDAPEKPTWPALNFTLKDLKGNDVNLMDYKGRVVLVVPIAWDDRNRRQFEDIEYWGTYFKDRGLVTLGVLTNSFNKETRTDAELLKLIDDRYRAQFQIFATTAVTGEKAHPLFKYLTSRTEGHKFGGEIKGAFTKFLISRNGEVVHRWAPEERIQVDGKSYLFLNDVLNTPMSDE